MKRKKKTTHKTNKDKQRQKMLQLSITGVRDSQFGLDLNCLF